MVQGGSFLRGGVSGGKCPGGNCLRGDMSWGKCLGGKCLGGKCPDTKKTVYCIVLRLCWVRILRALSFVHLLFCLLAAKYGNKVKDSVCSLYIDKLLID